MKKKKKKKNNNKLTLFLFSPLDRKKGLDPGDAHQLGGAGLLARLRGPGHLLAGVAVAERGVHDQRHRRRRAGADDFFSSLVFFVLFFSFFLSLTRSTLKKKIEIKTTTTTGRLYRPRPHRLLGRRLGLGHPRRQADGPRVPVHLHAAADRDRPVGR